MDDGVQIALAVAFPTGFDPADTTTKWPALFEMDGYEGGALPVSPASWGGHYVTIHASLRGTGCSGGAFDLFSARSAQDGHDIIDGWIANQPWSNGDVGIIGHSYPGLTGFWVHVTIIMTFLNFLPWGKHFHVVVGLPNVFLTPERRIAAS